MNKKTNNPSQKPFQDRIPITKEAKKRSTAHCNRTAKGAASGKIKSEGLLFKAPQMPLIETKRSNGIAKTSKAEPNKYTDKRPISQPSVEAPTKSNGSCNHNPLIVTSGLGRKPFRKACRLIASEIIIKSVILLKLGANVREKIWVNVIKLKIMT